MQSFFTSDLHLGHKVISKYRPIVTSCDHNTEFMLHKLSLLTKRDLLWVLGDFIFDHPHYESVVSSIQKMPFKLKLVMGNHDSLRLYRDFTSSIQLPLFSHKNCWVSHCPIHPSELRNRDGNVHGHLHHGHVKRAHYNIESDCNDLYLPDPRYFNVNIDVNDYEFVPYETIQSHFKGL